MIMYSTAIAILQKEPENRQYLMDGCYAPAKTPNVVPHDLGCPGNYDVIMKFFFTAYKFIFDNDQYNLNFSVFPTNYFQCFQLIFYSVSKSFFLVLPIYFFR